MSEDWDVYLCRVDGLPASIFVDLGIAEKVPIAAYPVMAYVQLNMRDPREDGLSGRAEFDTLVAIEDQIVSQLTLGEDALFVGRNTSNGCRDFYFYRKSSDGWDEQVAAAMAAFPDYRYESGVQSDPEWRTYEEFLFPGDDSFHSIQNRRVCDALQREGDRLSDSREIDHWAHFPTEGGRTAFIAEAEKLGFALRCMIEGEREQDRYGAQVFRSDVPGEEAIDAITWPLYEAAKRFGGEYDGWETFVIRGDRKNESIG